MRPLIASHAHPDGSTVVSASVDGRTIRVIGRWGRETELEFWKWVRWLSVGGPGVSTPKGSR